MDIVRASDPAPPQSRLNQWDIELSDSTGVSALVISNVATRVVVEVVVDKRFNCVDFIDGL